MGKLEPLGKKIMEVIAQLGEASISQILAKVGRYISEAKAIGHARIRSNSEPHRKVTSESGKRSFITKKIAEYCRVGKLRRVRKGVYTLPEPKLHIPPEQQSA